jgi:DNA repair protein RecO (recombination protein O)
MEIKVNAIVTRAIDYKDNDKILTLYSLEKGKISANIKGVKKPKAKLKFASEPFCFAEFILAEKSGRYTVINATYIDSFYNLRLDLLKYYLSACVADVINNLVEDGVADPQFFTETITAIKNICYQKNEKNTLALYLYRLAESLGYGVSETNCYDCGALITGRVFFRYTDAVFCCENCLGENFSEITNDTYVAYNTICLLNYETATEVEIKAIKINKLLKFLFHYLAVKTDVKLKSGFALSEFFAMQGDNL